MASEPTTATTTQPTLVGPIPKFPKVRCDACGQIYVSTVAVVVPTTKPCPTCGGGSFTSSFDSRPLGVDDA